jgi:hypothetical protein
MSNPSAAPPGSAQEGIVPGRPRPLALGGALDRRETERDEAAEVKGGLERWIVYTIVLWLVAFGSYLMSGPSACGETPAAVRSASGRRPQALDRPGQLHA